MQAQNSYLVSCLQVGNNIIAYRNVGVLFFSKLLKRKVVKSRNDVNSLSVCSRKKKKKKQENSSLYCGTCPNDYGAQSRSNIAM